MELEKDKLLDSLAREAADIKTEREREQAVRQARLEQLEQALNPRIQALYRYFRQLQEHLSVVQPEVSAGYVIPGYGPLGDLTQGGYRLYTDDPRDRVRKFTFQYEFRRDGRFEVHLKDRSKVAGYKERMWEYNLHFTTRDPGDGSSVFTFETRIPVSFAFFTDISRGGIRMTRRNVRTLGAVVNTLTPDMIDNELTGEIAKCVLGRANRVDELTGDALTKTARFQIRRRLMREVASRTDDGPPTVG